MEEADLQSVVKTIGTHRFAVRVLRELPGNGVLPVQHYMPGGRGDGLILRIEPETGECWIAAIAGRDDACAVMVLRGPAPEQLSVIIGGIGLYLDPHDRSRLSQIPTFPIYFAEVVPDLELLVLVDNTNVWIYSSIGAPRRFDVADDEIRDVKIIRGTVYGEASIAGSFEEWHGFSIDLVTGRFTRLY